MPPESRDAPEDLAEEAPCQVALGQLQDEVPGVPNEAATGLEQALLQSPRYDYPAHCSMFPSARRSYS
jgi:hypothetical protein